MGHPAGCWEWCVSHCPFRGFGRQQCTRQPVFSHDPKRARVDGVGESGSTAEAAAVGAATTAAAA
eukprot:6410731-Alexandrium_andersonii.AAC.1